MKNLFIILAISLLYVGTAFCQSKLSPDSTGVSGRDRISSLQWSRKLKDGKAVYYLFDATSGKTYPIYTAQFANYVFLGKDEAQNFYQPKLNGTGVPYINGSNPASFLQVSSAGTGSTLVTRDVNGKATFKDLDVAGVVHAKEVLVDQNVFPDYVFAPAYKLRNLNEVKSFLDKNHHLPDMPTENEIIQNGMNLAELNKVLVQKVEELTLYVIEKDHQLKSQEARLDKLEKVKRRNYKPFH